MNHLGKHATDVSSGLGALPSVSELVRMTKPMVGLLVVVSAIPGMLLAGTEFPKFSVFIAMAVGLFLVSGSGAILNQVLDEDIDGNMARTRQRLLPNKKMPTWMATTLGISMMSVGVGLIFWFASPLAASIAVAGNLFYLIVYTMILKRTTEQNIVIGGAAGAVGPLIGWASVAPDIGWAAWLMFAVIFLWTPPHFWALAIAYKDDYASANIPMMPCVRGERETKLQMVLYAAALMPVVLLLTYCAKSGPVMTAVASVLTLIFVKRCWDFYRTESNDDAMPLFQYSCMYLFLLFFGLTLERALVLLGA
jgi:protoheme IX farnesyltransferase